MGHQDHKTEERLSIRTNAEQKSLLRRAAEKKHLNVSQFVLQASLIEAERIIGEDARVRLTAEQFDWVTRLMDAPASEAPRLREALSQKPVWDV